VSWIKRTLALALGIYVVSYGLGLVEADNLFALLIGGLVLAGLNAFVKPILFVLTLPWTVLTMGLFIVVLNALLLGLALLMTPGLRSLGMGKTILAALLVSLVSIAVNNLIAPER
jgi:putative membrane protein